MGCTGICGIFSRLRRGGRSIRRIVKTVFILLSLCHFSVFCRIDTRTSFEETGETSGIVIANGCSYLFNRKIRQRQQSLRMAQPSLLNVFCNRNSVNFLKGKFEFCPSHTGNMSKLVDGDIIVEMIVDIGSSVF